MTEPQKEYIITQKALDDLRNYFLNHPDDLMRIAWKNFADGVRPYTSAEKVLDMALTEIENGLKIYVTEHEHQQACDNKGIYIPINIVRRLIKVGREKYIQKELWQECER